MDKAKLNNASSAAGRSLLEILWEELDAITDRLMADGKPEKGSPRSDYRKWGEERGRAQGLAYSIAVITNPYDIDVPAITEEAIGRWEDRNEEG